MHEITSLNAAAYLRDRGQASAGEPIDVCELSGGVSNVVLLVTLPERGKRFVLKQARGRLRVKEEWLCPVERIWQEVEVLRTSATLLGMQNSECRMQNAGGQSGAAVAEFEASVPEVLWEDRDKYLYAMSAAPEGHRTWKELLLAGETATGVSIATACGQLLGRLHANSWQNREIASRLENRTFFDELRLDPYYRHVAKAHADLASRIQTLIDSVWQHRRCLVHGDYSPKNLLVWPGEVMLIDFEVGHYGDPAFDLGFFLTHLLLKSIWAGRRRPEYLRLATTFWGAYRTSLAPCVSEEEVVALEGRMVLNLAGCMLARVDGKSPVDYLTAEQQESARQLSRSWIENPPARFETAIELLSTKY